MEYNEDKEDITLSLIRVFLNRSEISDLIKLLNTQSKVEDKGSKNTYRDGDWFESCKPDDHD